MSVNCTSLGKRISFYRSKSNLSQEALAAKINCSREHIVRIENGTKIPSISVLVKIANTLSVSADELIPFLSGHHRFSLSLSVLLFH